MALLNSRIAAISTEYVRVQVTATQSGLPHNPTGDNVYFQYTAVNTEPASPAPGTGWSLGTWETIGASYVALGLVGPGAGGTVLPTGTYAIWVQVTDNPEQPARNVGTLQIY